MDSSGPGPFLRSEKLSLSESLFNMGKILSHILFPVLCPVCGKLGSHGCEGCLIEQVIPLIPRCSSCSGIFPCGRHSKAFPVISGNLHEDLPRKIVLILKYGNDPQLGRIMGKVIARRLMKIEADFIVPVPLHRGTRRKFNQASLIAEGISTQWDIDVFDCLSWSNKTANQSSKASLEERRSLPLDIIKVTKKPGRRYSAVIVDDVVTTGSTLLRCAGSLEKAGIAVKAALTWTSAMVR